MKILNTSKNTVIAGNCTLADTFFSRFKGLMGVDSLRPGSGLLIVPCNSIHMFFMKFPLDIIFLDKNNCVVSLIEGIKPWQVSKIIRKAHSVLELPTGSIKASVTQAGDVLELIS